MRRFKSNKNCETHGQVTCGCGALLHRCKCQMITPNFRFAITCIHKVTTRELQQELIDEAVGRVGPGNIWRFKEAVNRIAKEEGVRHDVVFMRIDDAVKEKVGVSLTRLAELQAQEAMRRATILN